MKPETSVYLAARKIIPANSEKTVFFVGLTPTSREVCFYALIGGRYKQCFALAEEGVLDSNKLTAVLSEIAGILKKSELYRPGKYNAATITLSNIAPDGSGNPVTISVEYHELGVSVYKLQKAWKQAHLV